MSLTYRRVEVKTFVEHMYCPCGGEMSYDPKDGVMMSNPPQYQHRCCNCGLCVNVFAPPYPRTITREIEQ